MLINLISPSELIVETHISETGASLLKSYVKVLNKNLVKKIVVLFYNVYIAVTIIPELKKLNKIK